MIPHGGSEGAPRSGYYPDPSIPGYIRYWNGSSWVPGTSRPEPGEGEPMPAPPSQAAASDALAAGPPPSSQVPSTEETGPVFLDEDPDLVDVTGQVPEVLSAAPEVRPRGEVELSASMDWDDPSRMYGQRPEPASAWQADASWQAGYARQSEDRLSWGPGEGGETGLPGEIGSAPDVRADSEPLGVEGRTDSAASFPAVGGPDSISVPDAASVPGETSGAEAAPEAAQPPPLDGGTVQMRALSVEELRKAAAAEARGKTSEQQMPEHTVGLRRSDVLNAGPGLRRSEVPEHTVGLRRSDLFKPGAGSSGAAPTPPVVPGQGAPAQPQSTGAGAQAHAGQSPPAQPSYAQPSHARSPYAQPSYPQSSYPQPSPGQQTPGHGQPPSAQGGFGQGAPAQAPWAQQVQDLAGAGAASGQSSPQQGGGPEARTPWKPPSSDPFLQAASQQEARPGGLGKRFGARLVDGVLTAAVAVGASFPFAGEAVDHIQQKTDAVRQAGETKQVWLIDGTTGGYLAIVLGALALFGLLYEVLPTGRWGRTLGKKMFGLRVLTLEQHGKPGFGRALMRWLTHSVLSLLVIGVLNVLWCVFDRPWRQCWHDKLAGTFVSKDSGEIRLR